MAEKETFSVAWWNTSLAPKAQSRSSIEQKNLACNVIDQLIQMGKDFIALCEVSDDDIAYIRSHCQLDGYDLESTVTGIGRTWFDTCFIYNTKKIAIDSTTPLYDSTGPNTLKYAQRIEAVIGKAKTPFHLFLSHWPSRLWCPDNDPIRTTLGGRLRDAVNASAEALVKTHPQSSPHIILLGDYNDDPFSESLSRHLRATRDRHLATQKDYLMYNPFWRSMTAVGADRDYFCGSYFYKKGEITKWHTFDQIIFSNAFLKAKMWRLIEPHDNILCDGSLLQLVKDRNQIFDHLPVMAEMEKVS
ncbi:MAG: hypothetical protein RL748_1155 [Pseudomonadota bacterium]|jgi:hypothetical protein